MNQDGQRPSSLARYPIVKKFLLHKENQRLESIFGKVSADSDDVIQALRVSLRLSPSIGFGTHKSSANKVDTDAEGDNDIVVERADHDGEGAKTDCPLDVHVAVNIPPVNVTMARHASDRSLPSLASQETEASSTEDWAVLSV